MNIATDLQTIANNVPLVYNAGFEAGAAQGGGGGDTEAAYNQGFEAGKQSEYNAFWDGFQLNGSRTNYRRAFSGGGWTSDILKPKYAYQFPEGTTTNAYDIFSLCGTGNNETDGMIDVSHACAKLDFSKCRLVNNLFIDAFVKNITVDFTGAEQLSSVFSTGNGGKINNIKLKVSESCKFSNTFSYNGALVDLEFLPGSVIGNSISFSNNNNLSSASVQNIIDTLLTITDGVARTITFHATVKGKLTDEQKATITQTKGWTLA